MRRNSKTRENRTSRRSQTKSKGNIDRYGISSGKHKNQIMSKNHYREKLIGADAKIAFDNKNFKGKIIDETKNTISLKTPDNKIKKFIKKNIKIKLKNSIIDGKYITRRIEDRIKK
ncbi:hypothetical protein GF327_10000 [Candidatus Woesearchaeota archaeon]|nr:hypothetical protein [Candidatus Woesearchaeota archaeon]